MTTIVDKNNKLVNKWPEYKLIYNEISMCKFENKMLVTLKKKKMVKKLKKPIDKNVNYDMINICNG